LFIYLCKVVICICTYNFIYFNYYTFFSNLYRT
jgi:hypothetical protein